MKKLLFNLGAIALVMLSFNMAAQTTDLAVTVGSTLNIQVNQANVGIDMNDPSHFTAGNSSGAQTDHVQVTASESYYVEVVASGANFSYSGAGTGGTIPVNSIEVTLTDGGDMSGNQSTLSNITSSATNLALSTTAQTVVDVDGGDLQRGFDVNYIIPAAKAVNFLNQDAGSYSTTLTYTITPN